MMKRFIYRYILTHIITIAVVLLSISPATAQSLLPDLSDATVTIAPDQLDLSSGVTHAWRHYFTAAPTYSFHEAAADAPHGLVMLATAITLPKATGHLSAPIPSTFNTVLTLKPVLKFGRLSWALTNIQIKGPLPTQRQALIIRALARFGILSAWTRVVRNHYVAPLRGYRLTAIAITSTGITIAGQGWVVRRLNPQR